MPRVEAAIHSVHANAGIGKKKSKTKALSRAQRLRQQKSIERAEIVMDQLETKVSKSVGKAKTVNARKVQQYIWGICLSYITHIACRHNGKI